MQNEQLDLQDMLVNPDRWVLPEVIRVLASVPMLQNEAGRRALLVQAGLEVLLPVIKLDGVPLAAVSRLVSTLSDYGILRVGEPPVLRKFLRAVLDYGFAAEVSPTQLTVADVMARARIDPNFAAALACEFGKAQDAHLATLRASERQLRVDLTTALSNINLMRYKLDCVQNELSTMAFDMSNAWWAKEK